MYGRPVLPIILIYENGKTPYIYVYINIFNDDDNNNNN